MVLIGPKPPSIDLGSVGHRWGNQVHSFTTPDVGMATWGNLGGVKIIATVWPQTKKAT